MTRYIDEMNITAYQQSRWQDLARCIWCGFKSPDSGQCVCRYCDSCSRVWFSSVLADYKDEDTGPVSRWEYCPDCIASLCVDCGLSACATYTIRRSPEQEGIHSTMANAAHWFCIALAFYALIMERWPTQPSKP